jgi:type I restriction enzyme M protein
MALKKSELYSSIWQSCDELRGGMDASQYKDYVLVLLFVKYVSDKYAGQKDAMVEIPKGGSFSDMVALKGDKEIGDKINKIIAKLAEANDLKGVIDQTDFNDPAKLGSGKEMVDRLSNLVGIFDKPELNFRGNRAEGDDLLGDAYEYLMRHFATESGKSKGQFYTPAEVSRIMAKVIGIRGARSGTQTIYDPTCGSGSLLLKGHDEGKSATGTDITIYGQENDLATWAIARMNMFLHDCPSADIWKGNTLSNPHFTEKGKLKTFDFVVANPPFSSKAWSNGVNTENDPFGRFAFGVPPPKNGDYAFLLQVLASLKSTGKGAIIMPHGALYRGNAEADIRREIVRRGYIKGIISLPPNLFYGTGIQACIIVLDKENAGARTGIFMIDASKGFLKDGNKNRLREQDIHKIVDAFNNQIEIPKFSRMVPLAEISDPKNDFNLNLPRYVDSTEPEDLQDIDAHLRGGIPDRDITDLDRYWQVFPTLRSTLLTPFNRTGYSVLKVAQPEIMQIIYEHPEFKSFQQSITKLFEKWKATQTPVLKKIAVGDKPKMLILALAEDLLATFQEARLVDPYDVYQHLMDYWAETMQDDVYMLVSEGWKAVLEGIPNIDLIPTSLIVRKYFVADQTAIEQLEVDRDFIARQMEELDEEHGGEDGLLADAKNDKGNLTKASVKARIEEIADDKDADEERRMLKGYFALIEKEIAANKKVKEAVGSLDAKVAAKYGKLSEADIKNLIVNDKWMDTLAAVVQAELDRISQALTGRITQLAERYATPLPKLIEKVESLAARANEHLQRMGAIRTQELLTGEQRLPGFSKEWEVRSFDELFQFLKTANNSRADLSAFGEIGYIHYGDIHTTPSAFLNCDQADLPRIAKSKVRDLPLIENGDLVMADASEDYEGIGKSFEILNVNGRKIVAGLHTFLLRGNKELLADGFKGYLQFIPAVKSEIVKLATGISVYGVSKQSIRSIRVRLPEVPEQSAIAAVLSDMDAEIAALEQRRDKVRALKQGMMQELLIWKTRLI